MANVPTNIGKGTVVGQFLVATADSIDADLIPDAVPVVGTVTFTPSVSLIRNPTGAPNAQTILLKPVIGVIDSEGYLCNNVIDPITFSYQRGVPLIATDIDDVSPEDWTWKVTYAFQYGGSGILGPQTHSLQLEPNEIVDLTVVAPVTESGGVITTQGPQGFPGDLVPVTSGTWSGTVILPTYPSTYVATLSGNVTTLTLPTTMESTRSGTLTLILIQDATGSRTITWPVSIKWPDGIIQQPATAANSVSMIHLLWSGTTWYGMLGGKSFA